MTRVTFAASGPLSALGRRALDALLVRDPAYDGAVAARTTAIIRRVRDDGDAALIDLALELDGVVLESLEVPRADCRRALDRLDAPLRAALERAASNIEEVHRAFRPVDQDVTTRAGVMIGRRAEPIGRAGIYAPGGRASYPSSLLMGAVPARVAGVSEVVACSPPLADGLPAGVVRAACALGGVDRLFAIGGAGAIAAMAYGTTTVPAVDRVVGPGNAFVAEAKRQVAHVTPIDAPAGPSELLMIADADADPTRVAREMLAQAEHDPEAAVVLVALHPDMTRLVRRAIELAVDAEPRAAVIRAALASRGALLEATTLDEAISFANTYAAEHVLLALDGPTAELALGRIRAAGTIFLGQAPGVAFGDYMTGANHVLPTGGAARRYSGLSTESFMRWTTWQRIDRAPAGVLAPDVRVLAMAERLPAHAATALPWEVS